MTNIKEQLRQVDEEYLIGLSNKGIVKRAGKDLEKESPTVEWTETEAQVALKEETCVICVPLGDSRCSCPSRSICRHVVAAILWLRQEVEAEPEPAAETEGKAQAEDDKAKRGETAPFWELLQVPTARLQRACGSQRFRRFLSNWRAGEEATVEETSIITVTLPWEGAVVKLLEPLEHSSCSCHSRELCPHKAQALLAYQLKKGRVSLAELEAFLESETSFDLEAVREAAAAVQESVAGQFANGLARQSQEAEESLERLAVLCHRAGLAQMENRLREAAGEYRQYFGRSAAFRTAGLAGRLLFLYNRACRLEAAGSQEALRRLAGSFRDRYELVGRLRLMGIGVRSFASKSGYEGETWYFLEMTQRKWYTWTDARPTFYEGVKKRAAATENAPAPWNLGCSRQQLLELEFELAGAKAASGGRLSASQETRGETVGRRNLQSAAFRESIVWNYENLLREAFLPGQAQGQRERLVLTGAVRWAEPKFDPVAQRFSWQLYDARGHELLVSVKYTKKERLTIQLLERLEKRMWSRGCETLVCFGSLYLENGRLCLYPIELYPQTTRPVDECANERPAVQEGSGILRKKADLSAVQTISRYIDETFGLLTDLFTGGLLSGSEETAAAFWQWSEDGERLGLHQAAKELRQIGGCLQEKRHHMEFSPEPAIAAIERLWRYLTACREKLSYDEAALRMGLAEDERLADAMRKE